jgi:hypothetical protein
MYNQQITHFDDSFSTIDGLTWDPWIGEGYTDTGLLLLGESFYSEGSGWLSRRDAARHMVNNQGRNSSKPAFSKSRLFRSVERTLLSKSHTTMAEREALWTSTAFFNLVQRPMASRKERPKDSDFDLGWRVMLETAKVIKPQVCIRLGIAGIGRLGHYLANNDTGWKYNPQDFKKRPLVIHLRHENVQFKLVAINHPSGSFGYQYRKWAAVISEAHPVAITR